MSNYYIIDTTKRQGGKAPVMVFNTTDGIIKYLEGMCERHLKQTRKQYMFAASEIGHGDDDSLGRGFVEQMEQYFNMGVIRKDSVPVRCNIFQAAQFLKIKPTQGD